jgi:hypothetical protein
MDLVNVISKGTIKGKFMGFKNSYTKFEFADGQVWRQNESKFLNHYLNYPEAQIIFKDDKYYLEVKGISETVFKKGIKLCNLLSLIITLTY